MHVIWWKKEIFGIIILKLLLILITLEGLFEECLMVLLCPLFFLSPVVCKLFEGKLLRRFDPANLEWQILHHTHWSNSGSIKWEPEFSAPVCPPTMPTNHMLNSPSADRSIAFLLISWVKCTVEASLSFGSNLFKLFSFFWLFKDCC